jgi:excisionase family DNA binding protein
MNGTAASGTWRPKAHEAEVQMSVNGTEAEHLLTPAEVAALFRVDPKTVTRWAKAGKLSSIRTLGGHRRYRSAEVHALLQSQSPSQSPRRSSASERADHSRCQ